jgi:hypothetical protein
MVRDDVGYSPSPFMVMSLYESPNVTRFLREKAEHELTKARAANRPIIVADELSARWSRRWVTARIYTFRLFLLGFEPSPGHNLEMAARPKVLVTGCWLKRRTDGRTTEIFKDVPKAQKEDQKVAECPAQML